MIPILMHQMRIWTTKSLGTQAEKFEIREKNCENCKRAEKPNMCHENEPNMWTIASFLLILLVIRMQTSKRSQLLKKIDV
jgi:hypothetical protein